MDVMLKNAAARLEKSDFVTSTIRKVLSNSYLATKVYDVK